MPVPNNTIASARHPQYLFHLPDWQKWRWIWEGGESFRQRYLYSLSDRESQTDFDARKKVTPIPAFAKAAIVDIKNSVFHRMSDIARRGGSPSYESAVAGYNGGVDRRGSSMNHFVGTNVLPEMLAMGKCGVFVDNVAPPGPTKADATQASPFLYTYPIEDILSWDMGLPHEESELRSILLRDWTITYTNHFGTVHLPTNTQERLRLVWIGDDGFVWYQFFDPAGNPVSADGVPGESPTRLNLRKIPFVICDIGISLLNDIADYQIALLNMVSTDVAYSLKANFPFYVEQQDRRAVGSHLKSDVMEDGTATSGGQSAAQKEIKVGTIHGRTYDINTDTPTFINPSSEPLLSSTKLQEKFENDIRKLVNLAVISLGNNRASEGSRAFDNQGLEAGLAFIGLVLETAERKIGEHWSAYEGNDNTVVVKYPEQYSRKSMETRIDESQKIADLTFQIPSLTAKKELAKDIIVSLMGGRATPEKIAEINKEIDEAKYSTSDPDVIKLAKEEGLASDVTCSNALGFEGEEEVEQANLDHAKRIARIQSAQTSNDGTPDNPGARGVDDLEVNRDSASEEREEATDTTEEPDTKRPVRGEGKQNSDD